MDNFNHDNIQLVATSMFNMIFTSIAGASVKITMGHIYPDLAVFLILGIILGAQIGPMLIKRINTDLLQRIFGFMMILALISIVIGRDQVVTLIQGFFNYLEVIHSEFNWGSLQND